MITILETYPEIYCPFDVAQIHRYMDTRYGPRDILTGPNFSVLHGLGRPLPRLGQLIPTKNYQIS